MGEGNVIIISVGVKEEKLQSCKFRSNIDHLWRLSVILWRLVAVYLHEESSPARKRRTRLSVNLLQVLC